jgi:hypothetical protein
MIRLPTRRRSGDHSLDQCTVGTRLTDSQVPEIFASPTGFEPVQNIEVGGISSEIEGGQGDRTPLDLARIPPNLGQLAGELEARRVARMADSRALGAARVTPLDAARRQGHR